MTTPHRPQPIDVLWQSATLVSIFAAGELLAIILTLAPADSGRRLVSFGLLSFAVQWVTLFTLGAMYAVRGWLGGLRARWVVITGLVVMFAVSMASAGVAWELLGPLWKGEDLRWFDAGLRFAATLMAMAMLGVLALGARWNAQRLSFEAKEAELQALHARIRPHFLFNALNAGAALVHQKPEQAERLLLDLADLFRAALMGPRLVPIAEELALTQRYVEIESLRFGPRLRVIWEVPEPLPDVRVPILSLQPLVENAVRHGVEPSPTGGEVRIRVFVSPSSVEVEVSNTLPATPPRVDGHQVGLRSSRARFEAVTNGAGRIDTRNADGRFTATVTVPNVTG